MNYWRNHEEHAPDRPYQHKITQRCDWCGEVISHEQVDIASDKEFSIICSSCLDWERDDGKIVVKHMSNVRPGPIVAKDSCGCGCTSRYSSEQWVVPCPFGIRKMPKTQNCGLTFVQQNDMIGLLEAAYRDIQYSLENWAITKDPMFAESAGEHLEQIEKLLYLKPTKVITDITMAARTAIQHMAKKGKQISMWEIKRVNYRDNISCGSRTVCWSVRISTRIYQGELLIDPITGNVIAEIPEVKP